MLNTKSSNKQKVKSRLLAGRKLIILSIVLLTTLSATLISNLSETTQRKVTGPKYETSFESDLEQTKKLKLFNAKDYMEDYERQKKAKAMLKESLESIERTHSK